MNVKARTQLTWTVLTAWWIAATFGQNNCRAKFDIHKVCYEDYGTLLLQQLALSVTACVQMCTMEGRCRSFTYDPRTKICRTIQGTHSSFPSGCAEQLFYGEVVQAACHDTFIGDACALNTDCATPNSGCYSGTCRCKPGYSYGKNPEGCYTYCPAPGYGSTWTDQGYYLEKSNNVRTTANSQDHCKYKCLVATGFTCRFIEYVYSNGECNLSELTGSSAPGSVINEANGDWVEAIRNCY